MSLAGVQGAEPLGLPSLLSRGLLLSQALTLYTTPVIYLYLDGLQHALAPKRRRVPRLAEKLSGA